MESESGTPIEALTVDGGATANNFLMQFQADILGKPIHRPAVIETTAMGAAFLAGLKVGIWKSSDELISIHQIEKEFEPTMDTPSREALLEGWDKALRQAMTK
jgi:glycerol kinase